MNRKTTKYYVLNKSGLKAQVGKATWDMAKAQGIEVFTPEVTEQKGVPIHTDIIAPKKEEATIFDVRTEKPKKTTRKRKTTKRNTKKS